jgi:hypothetical protein
VFIKAFGSTPSLISPVSDILDSSVDGVTGAGIEDVPSIKFWNRFGYDYIPPAPAPMND